MNPKKLPDIIGFNVDLIGKIPNPRRSKWFFYVPKDIKHPFW
jgi:hypothetical protein